MKRNPKRDIPTQKTAQKTAQKELGNGVQNLQFKQPENSLQKRARKKHASDTLAKDLMHFEGVGKKHMGYALTFACSSVMEVTDTGKLRTAFHCHKRWCPSCASITMATLINKYEPIFREFKDLYFVTLTIPNCRNVYLRKTYSDMLRVFTNIAKAASRKGIVLKGIRKYEVKGSKNAGYYHPHFHLLVEGKECAEFLVDEWLKRMPNANRRAQDARKVDNIEKSLKEVFKYASKITCAENAANTYETTAQQMDTIFRAIKGKRIYQTFGGVRAVTGYEWAEDEETLIKAQGYYQWAEYDWYHTETGEALANIDEADQVQHLKTAKERTETAKERNKTA